MRIFHSLQEWQLFQKHRDNSRRLGFIPTMGALHPGHLSLIERSCKECQDTLVSIFVNPTQFNQESDFDQYPRHLEEDARLAESAGATWILAPSKEAFYPDDYRYRVTENKQSLTMEGASRPGHFDGVLTIVLKLLMVAGAQKAYFGEKDWQQLSLVRGMIEAFFLPVQLVPCPTVREADGLAMSSRNTRLSPEGRKQAARFPEIMAMAPSPEEAVIQLENAGFTPDYVRDEDGRRLGAILFEGVRLIDNLPLNQLGKWPVS